MFPPRLSMDCGVFSQNLHKNSTENGGPRSGPKSRPASPTGKNIEVKASYGSQRPRLSTKGASNKNCTKAFVRFFFEHVGAKKQAKASHGSAANLLRRVCPKKKRICSKSANRFASSPPTEDFAVCGRKLLQSRISGTSGALRHNAPRRWIRGNFLRSKNSRWLCHLPPF